MDKIRIMLDLETLSTSENAAIISVGAVMFDEEITSSFYSNVSFKSTIDNGFDVSGDTLAWWFNQSKEAQERLLNGPEDLEFVLNKFIGWIAKNSENGEINPKKVEVWGNGSDFDNVILANAFKRFGIKQPWAFWNNRCYRTLKNVFVNIKPPTENQLKHDALSDAKFQALHLIEILKAIKS